MKSYLRPDFTLKRIRTYIKRKWELFAGIVVLILSYSPIKTEGLAIHPVLHLFIVLILLTLVLIPGFEPGQATESRDHPRFFFQEWAGRHWDQPRISSCQTSVPEPRSVTAGRGRRRRKRREGRRRGGPPPPAGAGGTQRAQCPPAQRHVSTEHMLLPSFVALHSCMRMAQYGWRVNEWVDEWRLYCKHEELKCCSCNT